MHFKKVLKEKLLKPLGILPVYHKLNAKILRAKQQQTRSSITPVYWKDTHEELEFDAPYSTTSMLCNSSFFDMPFFQYWAAIVHDNFVDLMRSTNQLTDFALKDKVVYHRKLWEFVYIAHALYERGVLKPGKRGLGFGVGTEALVSVFASMGCEVLATDLDSEKAQEAGWTESFQHASDNLESLNRYKICTEDVFTAQVSYRNVNMNDIPSDIKQYDFNWSACAFEHLGSIKNGCSFIKNCLKTLSPGGIAVHTTEFNVFSDRKTIDNNPHWVLFRKKDILKLVSELEEAGHYVWPVDFNSGNQFVDNFVDFPPFSQQDVHLKLQLSAFTSTSIGLIIMKDGRQQRGSMKNGFLGSSNKQAQEMH